MKIRVFSTTLLCGLFLIFGSISNAEESIDTTDLIVIFDTSGSMGEGILDESGQQVTKIAYAQEKLKEIMSLFSEEENRYNLNFIHFNGQPVMTEIGLINQENYPQLEARINALRAGGGTPLADSIRTATDLFLSTEAEQKSLIILSDGQDAGGVENLLSAMTDLENRTNGSVMVQFFALGVDQRTWQSFRQVSQVIQLGTLFLVEGGSSGGDFFSLTYDAISGNWSGSQLRQGVGERLGHIHAEQVHVISALDRASTRGSGNRLETINWDQLQSDDPDLYNELRTWFENLEDQYQTIQIREAFEYLLNDVVRTQMSPEDIPSNWEAYKAEVRASIEHYIHKGNSLANAARLSQSDLEEDSDFLGLVGNTSYNTLGLFINFSLPSMNSTFASSTVVDLTSAYMIMEIVDFMSDENFDAQFVETTIDSVTSVTAMVIFMNLFAVEPVNSVLSFKGSGGVLLSSFITSNTFGYSSYDSDNSFAGIGIAERQEYVTQTQEQEYQRYEQFIQREEVLELLESLLPDLSRADIIARIEEASSNDNPSERARILFAGNTELLERLAVAETITDGVRNNPALVETIQAWADKEDMVNGLRGSGQLPENVQAYLNNLARQIDNSQFDHDVNLFLRGAGSQ